MISTLILLAFFQSPDPYAKAADVLKGVGNSAMRTVESVQPSMKVRPKKRPDITGTIAPIELHRIVALSPSALRAVDVSNAWASRETTPMEGKDGRVVFTYGEGEPTIVTGILQVTEVDLEPGEEVIPDGLDIGAYNVFEIKTRKVGQGSDGFTYLAIKPKEPGLDTTLVVGTTRRSYYMRLVSTEQQHIARVAFTYPEDEARARRAALEAQRMADEKERQDREALKKAEVVSIVRHTNYEVKVHGKFADYLRPVENGVWDDGIHTHIKLQASAKYRGVPVPKISNATGAMAPNYRWQDSELIIDAIFEKACLVEGVGRHRQQMCVTNRNLK